MSRDWTKLVERQLARAPNSVGVRCAGETSHGPLDVLPSDQGDGSSARIRAAGYQLTLPAAACPSAQEGSVVTCVDRHGVETRYRVHQRYAVEDGLTHVLVLAQVAA